MSSVHTSSDETNDDGRPHAVGSYALPMIVVILGCLAFLVWRRRQQNRQSALGFQSLASSRQQGVRLSTDDDGPPANAFISNNPSDDELSPSLPSIALPTIRHPAHEDPLRSDNGTTAASTFSEPVFSRRTIRELSRRQVGAVEGESSEEEEDVEGADVFKIGNGKEERDEVGLGEGGFDVWDRR